MYRRSRRIPAPPVVVMEADSRMKSKSFRWNCAPRLVAKPTRSAAWCSFRDTAKAILQMKSGLPAYGFAALRDELNISAEELRRFVGIARHTLLRRKQAISTATVEPAIVYQVICFL